MAGLRKTDQHQRGSNRGHALERRIDLSFPANPNDTSVDKGCRPGFLTRGKIIDSGPSALASNNSLNTAPRLYFDPKEGRGPADFDIRHSFVFNYVWELPGPHSSQGVLHWVTNGWQ